MGNETSTPAGPASMTDEEYRVRSISKMDTEMRRKYAQGAKFNFKVVVRGDSSTGKSTLLRRLRGGTFIPDYVPTPEIKTAHIQWTARSSPEDNVMLEVWDVVDKASKRKISDSLTLANANRDDAESGQHTFPLDATVVDVYQGCHAAIFLVDPSKKWTYEYVQRELALVPEHIPTCILINFRDYPASKRAIRPEEVEADCGYAFGKRPFRPFVVETSLLNCYGLQALSTFLHIPFLCLKRASLEQAMQLNTHAIVQAQEALKTVKGSRYDEYERRIEAATGAEGGSASVAQAHAAAGNDPSAAGAAASGASVPPAGPREAAITWEKLSKTTLGEAPILLGSAAVSGIISGVSAVAATTPADIAENVKSLASLKTLGLGPAEKKGNFVAEPRERVAPQFSHLTGRGGAAAAAFGGTEIDDEDDGSDAGERPREHSGPGPRAGMKGGGEHPDVAAHVGDDSADFFDADTPRAPDGDDSGPFRDDGGPSDDDANDDDAGAGDDSGPGLGPGPGPGGLGPARDWDDESDDGGGSASAAAVVRWDDDDDEDSDDARERDDDDISDDPMSPKLGVVRQISAEDPFFGAPAASKPKNVEVLRAAEMDLDPSAIAASFGSPGDAAEAYETVKDSADAMLATAISLAEKSGSSGSLSKGDVMKASGSGSFLSDSDSDSEARRARKKKDKSRLKKAAKGDAADEGTGKEKKKKSKSSKKANKAEDESESASKSKKKKKAAKDWDESDGD
jgi:GTPase SAR1 family protein